MSDFAFIKSVVTEWINNKIRKDYERESEDISLDFYRESNNDRLKISILYHSVEIWHLFFNIDYLQKWLGDDDIKSSKFDGKMPVSFDKIWNKSKLHISFNMEKVDLFLRKGIS